MHHRIYSRPEPRAAREHLHHQFSAARCVKRLLAFGDRSKRVGLYDYSCERVRFSPVDCILQSARKRFSPNPRPNTSQYSDRLSTDMTAFFRINFVFTAATALALTAVWSICVCVCVCVCLSVWHRVKHHSEPCKNGRTDCEASLRWGEGLIGRGSIVERPSPLWLRLNYSIQTK